jgi:hypothetical protein
MDDDALTDGSSDGSGGGGRTVPTGPSLDGGGARPPGIAATTIAYRREGAARCDSMRSGRMCGVGTQNWTDGDVHKIMRIPASCRGRPTECGSSPAALSPAPEAPKPIPANCPGRPFDEPIAAAEVWNECGTTSPVGVREDERQRGHTKGNKRGASCQSPTDDACQADYFLARVTFALSYIKRRGVCEWPTDFRTQSSYLRRVSCCRNGTMIRHSL